MRIAPFAFAFLLACGTPSRDGTPIVVAPPPSATASESPDASTAIDPRLAKKAIAEAQAEADERLQNKLDIYIKCLNTISGPLHTAHRTYQSAIPRTGPTAKSTSPAYDLLARGVTSTCASSVSDIKTTMPRNTELEDGGAAFAKAATTYDAALVDAKPYFEKEEWKRDSWTKGKALHARLVEAFDAFTKADKNLHDVVDGITRPLAKRTLARIADEEGMNYRYHRKRVLITAREVVETADPPNDNEIDVNVFEGVMTSFATAVVELTTYAAAHRADLENAKTPVTPGAAANLDAFVTDARATLAATQSLLACLRSANKPRVDVGTLSTCPEGKGTKVQDDAIRAYNQFVRTSNAHPFP